MVNMLIAIFIILTINTAAVGYTMYRLRLFNFKKETVGEEPEKDEKALQAEALRKKQWEALLNYTGAKQDD